ncbi:MAG: hypothetical protein AB7L18_11455, partial [Hyphomicrobiaceae bacterium]
MTYLLGQAFLLMLAAYFLGAFLGCLMRRLLAHRVIETDVGVRDAMAGATVGGAIGPTVHVPRSQPIPVQPKIEYAAPPEGQSDAMRFERALSGVGSMTETFDEAATVTGGPGSHLTDDQSAYVPAAEPSPRVVEPEILRADTSHAAPAPSSDAIGRSTAAVAAAAAAAAAAALAQSARAEARDREREAAEAARRAAERAAVPPAPIRVVPAAAYPAAGGMTGTSTEVRMGELPPPVVQAPPPAAPTPTRAPIDGDDLTLIRGIDAETAAELADLGALRYADITRWTSMEVDIIDTALGTKGRVARENWIEQAAMLERGVYTDYAKRRRRGEHASAQPSGFFTARPPMVAAPPPLSVSPDVTAQAALSARSAGSAATAAAAAIAVAAAAANRGASVSERRPTAAPRTAPAAPAPAAPARTPAAAPPKSAAHDLRAHRPDLLQRIRGLDAHAQRVLAEQGVSRYADIATWTAADVARFDALLGMKGRISRQNWIEQAQILAGGGLTDYARRLADDTMIVMHPSAPPPPVRPARLADAIRENTAAARPAGGTDVAGLRSVRSEALKPATPSRIGQPGRSAAREDLKRIRGIGVLIEKKLNALGIHAYDDIANWTAQDIER